jgi:hypothetical protein
MQSLLQGRCLLRSLDPLDSLYPPLDLSINLLLVIPVVRQGRVDLAQRQIGVLEMKLFGTPPISLLRHTIP